MSTPLSAASALLQDFVQSTAPAEAAVGAMPDDEAVHVLTEEEHRMLVEANIMMEAALEGTKKQAYLFQQFNATMTELSDLIIQLVEQRFGSTDKLWDAARQGGTKAAEEAQSSEATKAVPLAKL